MAEEYQKISELLIAGDIERVKELTQKALDECRSPEEGPAILVLQLSSRSAVTFRIRLAASKVAGFI